MSVVTSLPEKNKIQPVGMSNQSDKDQGTDGDVSNPGVEFQPQWLNDIRINLSALQRRTATLTSRRSLKKSWQAAWLLKAVSCIDLTTLSGQDTPGKVRRLCAKARTPISHEL